MHVCSHNLHLYMYTVPKVVAELSDDLCITYKRNRKRSYGEEWPPDLSSSTVNLALIHYQNRRTQEEINEISKRCKEGASQVDKMIKLDSNITKDIQEIFMSKSKNNSPQYILIEGAPGIGKTVLAKEIAYQWAIDKILKEYQLVFLLYLRDPQLHLVKSFNEILKLFTSEKTSELTEFIKKSRGKNVAFLFDGFDEYPVALQRESFITNFIKGKNNERTFLESMVIVTSRPTATLFLHNIVDRRIEILGFPKEERDKYVLLSLKNSVSKKQVFDKYLQLHPIIDNLCYVPLHLAILMFLFQQDDLPETLTEMNESFIINTIHRYLERYKKCPTGIVKKLIDLPKDVIKFVNQLSQLAFNGLRNNQLVFTHDEVMKVCPEVENIPGGINGFGLLQAVQHYPKRGVGITISVNFLHFTMQEYFSAFYVSTLPSQKQSLLMKRTFWNGQLNFMWMMYVGITGVKSNTFKYFIGDSDFVLDDSDSLCDFVSDDSDSLCDFVLDDSDSLCDYVSDDSDSLLVNRSDVVDKHYFGDKRKCLHLFLCYMEAKSDKDMPKAILSMFTDCNIILNGITLLPHNISSLLFFMSASVTQRWKTLQLCDCNLGDIEMNCLLEHAIKSHSVSTLEYVDLSRNRSSPWGVYCAIIGQCCVSSLTLLGEEGMQEYGNDIIDNLQTNTVLKSLTLCSSTLSKRYNEVVIVNSIENTLAIDGKLLLNTLVNNDERVTLSSDRMVSIKILYDYNDECLSETNINLSNKHINDDTVCLITLGLYNNTMVKELDISYNNLTDNGAIFISNFLKHNNTLQKLNISHNYIADDGVADISDSLRCNNVLQKLDISHNIFTTKGTIFISNSLKHNNTLQKLGISHNNITDDGVTLIFDCLKCNKALYKIDISHNDITNDGAMVIIDCLKHNNTIKELNLSHNSIDEIGMDKLSECVKHTTSLEYIDFSENISTPWKAYCAIIRDCHSTNLTLCGDEGIKTHAKEMVHSLQINETLQSLTLCGRNCKDGTLKGTLINGKLFFSIPNMISDGKKKALNKNKRMVDIKVKILCYSDHECSSEAISITKKSIDHDELYLISLGLYNNTTIKKLDLSFNNISYDGLMIIIDCLKYNNTIKELNLSHNNIDVKGMNKLSQHALSLEYVDLSENISTPWKAYCAIIRDCYSNNLTLCGDKGIQAHATEIIGSLQTNTTLQSLTLHGYMTVKSAVVINGKLFFGAPIGDDGKKTSIDNKRVVNVKVKILCYGDHGCSSEIISMSKESIKVKILYNRLSKGIGMSVSREVIDLDALYLILLGLYNNTSIKTLDLSCNKITNDDLMIIIDCLKHNNTIKELNLSHNSIDEIGMDKLSEFAVSLVYIDLSKNASSPWKTYCAIIRYCHSNSLTLCGDEGIKAHAKEITESLQINTTLQSLTLHGYMTVWSAVVINGKLFFGIPISDDGKKTSIDNKRVVNVKVKILCYGDHGCSSEIISMSKESIKVKILYNRLSKGIGMSVSREVIDLDALYLILLGLYNNTSIKTLDLSCNKITNDDLMIIIDCLKHNNTIKELNLSHNSIDEIGMDKLSEFALSLAYIDLSENTSSPWKAYCAIIRYCHSNSLTLCGDEGIKAHAKEITESLQINTTLQSLTLYGYMGMYTKTIKSPLVINGNLYFSNKDQKKASTNYKRVVDIEVNILYYNHHECLPKVISMSKQGINDDTLFLVTLGLYNNTTVKQLDLSYNKITDDGILALSNCLKHNCSLEVLKLSGNSIFCKGAKNILEAIHKSKVQKLDLSHTCISIDGVIAISEYLKTDNTLRLLNLSDNPDIRDAGVMYISDSLKTNNTLLELKLSRIGIGDKGAKSIIRAVQVNKALQKLDLSCNYISKDMVTALSIRLEHHRKLKAEVIWKSQLQIDYKYK